MKKSFKTVVSFMLITLLVISFSSCSIFEAMRENALNAGKIEILDTPEKEKIIAEYNRILEASLDKAVTVKENVSYSAGSPNVLKGEEEAGLLDTAANQIKNFIMSANPGSAEYWVKGAPEGDGEYNTKTLEESLISKFDEASLLGFDFNRNIATENVTDDKGENVTDEEGNAVTEDKISDNILHLTINYFADELTVLGEGVEAVTNENGEEVEQTTTIYAEPATIESVFGSNKDKEAVLKNFECVKDYITVSDYEIEYKNCYVTTDTNLEAETVSFINFQKNMTVTAKAEGVGELASYGEITVVFDLTMTTYYEFTYAEEETDASSEDTAAAAEDTTAAEETTVEETSAEETTLTEEETEETTAEISEETSAEESTAA